MNDFSALSEHDWPEFQAGSVWLLGAGPGDPGLMTIYGYSAIKQADAIVYDALVGEPILGWARTDAQMIYAGKKGGKASTNQSDITETLIDLAKQGKRVLRLKGGDPFVFARGGEEIEQITAQGISVRVISGITAGIGGLASAGIPLTHRDINQSVTFITGHDKTGEAPSALDWEALGKTAQVLVIYMGMKHIKTIADRLIAAGRDPSEPVAIVSKATHPDQQTLITTLQGAAKDVEEAGLEPPSIICIGYNVGLRDKLGLHGGDIS